MVKTLKFLTAVTAIALFAAAPLSAQETATDGETTDPETTVAPEPVDDTGLGLSLGEDVSEGSDIGRSYTVETHGDWEIRCIKAASGKDPCQLYQLLHDAEGNSVAEISMFALPAGQTAVAGATVAAPLETLLTKQLTLSIDQGQARRYPFTWCSKAGCFARIGFSAGDIASFKRGVEGVMSIVPVGAPDSTVALTISLAGFTAGYDSVTEMNKE